MHEILEGWRRSARRRGSGERWLGSLRGSPDGNRHRRPKEAGHKMGASIMVSDGSRRERSCAQLSREIVALRPAGSYARMRAAVNVGKEMCARYRSRTKTSSEESRCILLAPGGISSLRPAAQARLDLKGSCASTSLSCCPAFVLAEQAAHHPFAISHWPSVCASPWRCAVAGDRDSRRSNLRRAAWPPVVRAVRAHEDVRSPSSRRTSTGLHRLVDNVPPRPKRSSWPSAAPVISLVDKLQMGVCSLTARRGYGVAPPAHGRSIWSGGWERIRMFARWRVQTLVRMPSTMSFNATHLHQKLTHRDSDSRSP